MPLTTASEVIDALGGTKAVAEALNVGASAVSNYRKQGFPARQYGTLAQLCAARQLDVDNALFGGLTPPPASGATPPTAPAASGTADTLMQIFAEAGFNRINTHILQPAAPYIKLLGEEMRARLYMFTGPDGEELCLRPDLTVPTVRAYVERGMEGEKRLSYCGTAFRYQPRGVGQPEEFTQVGFEIINGTDFRVDEDAALRLIVQAVEAAGLQDYIFKINDMLLFTTFLQLRIPNMNIRDRLILSYRQGADMDITLARLSRPREMERAPHLDAEICNKIADLLRLDAPLAQTKAAFPEELHEHMERLEAQAEAAGVASDRIRFAPALGRKLAYYNGLAFEIHAPKRDGTDVIVATGGHYIQLLTHLGARGVSAVRDTLGRAVGGAVGGAVNLERLADAVEAQT